ncbi:NUDIX domain-containing protein [Prauserella alba]|uniref:NUDIX hydrolase n=1 Tax=Prauserella alba TaxID=176898 RepID=A0ABP4G0G3_9PSEU|nr:NUDIX hydrolase [Prauserella alba]MCP2180015.1 8-oxo-dGTP diphosphatase [Prauserella alba]
MGRDEMANLTADVALFSLDERDRPCVLLIRRGWDPFEGHWALPGGHVDAGESTEVAAHRELAEETGLRIGSVEPVGVYAAPGRDPRGRYVTFAYATTVGTLAPQLMPIAGDDATEAHWLPVADVLGLDWLPLAFDHRQIIRDAARRQPWWGVL